MSMIVYESEDKAWQVRQVSSDRFALCERTPSGLYVFRSRETGRAVYYRSIEGALRKMQQRQKSGR